MCISLEHIACHISFFVAATVHIEGSEVCTLSYTCSRGYTDVAKYLIMEKKIYHILGTYNIVIHCLTTKGLQYSSHASDVSCTGPSLADFEHM